MGINIGNELQNRLQDIITKITEKQNVILDTAFYTESCRVIFRNNDERKTYKAIIPYSVFTCDDNLKDRVNIRQHFDRKYEKLH